MLPDSNGRWNLINDEIHYNIGFRNAKLALVIGVSSWQAKGSVSDYNIEVMDSHKRTEIDKMVFEFVKACASRNPQNVTNAMNDILLWQKTKTCDYCGKQRKQMYDCIRCKGAGYCNSTCQRLRWSSHKRVCGDLEKAIQNETEERQSSGSEVKLNQKMVRVPDDKTSKKGNGKLNNHEWATSIDADHPRMTHAYYEKDLLFNSS
jgi:hypothetical protein